MAEVDEFEETREILYETAFLPHVALKLIPLMFYYGGGVLGGLLNPDVITQVVVVLIVIDFWMTKNINARKMIGLTWDFVSDEYGNERFQVECRVNPEVVHATSSRLFWISLGLYILIPAISFTTLLPLLLVLTAKQVFILIIMLISGLANGFFLFKAMQIAQERQIAIRNSLGQEFVRNMEEATIVTYL